MEACSEALYLLATTVDGVESWLWPCLISALLDQACITSVSNDPSYPKYIHCALNLIHLSPFHSQVTSVLRSLSPLAIKIIRNESLSSSTNERDFPGTKVLARCLELLCDPINRLPVINFLKSAAPLVGYQVISYWNEKLSELSQELQDEKSIQKNIGKMESSMQLW